MDLASTFIPPKEWQYRGEGNCNVVISLPKTRQILRIRKTDKPKSLLNWILVLISDIFYWYYGTGPKEEVRDMKFYTKVIRPLMGETYTSECQQVILGRKQMQIFRETLEKKRPEHRRYKILQYSRAALFDDFAFLPSKYKQIGSWEDTYAVELKPKHGWRPLKEQNYPECFFCMHQYLKLDKKLFKSRTHYCPEELFSGDKVRMKNAIKNLLEVPQNNLKIFKNGSICFDAKHHNLNILQEIFQTDEPLEDLKEEFSDFLQKCLATDLENVDSKCICHTTTSLTRGSVLEKIFSLQMFDDQGTHSTYKKWSKCDIWEDFSFVDRFLELLSKQDKCCVRCLVESTRSSENELMFLPYLISSIARDCSLMVTFRKLNENYGGINVFETKYGSFLVHIGVFDLYPKPLSTIPKHYKRNREIFRALKKKGLFLN